MSVYVKRETASSIAEWNDLIQITIHHWANFHNPGAQDLCHDVALSSFGKKEEKINIDGPQECTRTPSLRMHVS